MLMPPKKMRPDETFSSSVNVGVYSGTSVTSCPMRISSRARLLSRMQLPQYMLAAPAVICRIRMRQPAIWKARRAYR